MCRLARGAAEPRLFGEIGGVDDQRVAFPAARPSRPSTCVIARRQVLGVHADDPRVVHHLGEDHHRVRRLHDLVAGCCRSSSAAPAARRSIRTPSGSARRAAGARDRRTRRCPRSPDRLRARSDRRSAATLRADALPRLRRQRRHAAVRRIDDDRRALAPSTTVSTRSRVDPEAVVAADVAGRAGRAVAAKRRRGAIGLERRVAVLLARGAACCSSFVASSSVITSGDAGRAARSASASRCRRCPADPDGRRAVRGIALSGLRRRAAPATRPPTMRRDRDRPARARTRPRTLNSESDSNSELATLNRAHFAQRLLPVRAVQQLLDELHALEVHQLRVLLERGGTAAC